MKKLFFLLLIGFFTAACGGKDFSPNEETGLQLARKVTLFQSQGNKQQWLLRADSVDFSDLKSATLKNPELLLKQEGKDSGQVKGETGTFDYPKKLVTIDGNALIESFTERLTIRAERFFYDVDKDRVWSEGKTVITRNGVKVVAKGGVETDSKLAKIEIKKHATHLPKTTQEL